MKSHLLKMHNIEIDERPDEAPANVDRVTCDLCKKGFCSVSFVFSISSANLAPRIDF